MSNIQLLFVDQQSSIKMNAVAVSINEKAVAFLATFPDRNLPLATILPFQIFNLVCLGIAIMSLPWWKNTIGFKIFAMAMLSTNLANQILQYLNKTSILTTLVVAETFELLTMQIVVSFLGHSRLKIAKSFAIVSDVLIVMLFATVFFPPLFHEVLPTFVTVPNCISENAVIFVCILAVAGMVQAITLIFVVRRYIFR